MEATVSANGSFITPEAVAGKALFSRKVARWRWTSALVEFLRFGIKQGWACLFGGIAVGLMISTAWFYPTHAPLVRYDFLFLCMLGVQIALLTSGLETWEEAKVILVYHAVGTLMEIFQDLGRLLDLSGA